MFVYRFTNFVLRLNKWRVFFSSVHINGFCSRDSEFGQGNSKQSAGGSLLPERSRTFFFFSQILLLFPPGRTHLYTMLDLLFCLHRKKRDVKLTKTSLRPSSFNAPLPRLHCVDASEAPWAFHVKSCCCAALMEPLRSSLPELSPPPHTHIFKELG